jgi:hypothetical protein
MKCKLTIKNRLQWLTNEDKNLPLSDMSSHNLLWYKIKVNLSLPTPYLDKNFKTQWANIAVSEISNFDELIALIPPKFITFYESTKDVSHSPPRTRQWTWQRPTKITRYNALNFLKTIDFYAKQRSVIRILYL